MPFDIPLTALWIALAVVFGLSILSLLFTAVYGLVEDRLDERRAPELRRIRAQLVALAADPQASPADPLPRPRGRTRRRQILVLAADLLKSLEGESRANLVAELTRAGYRDRAVRDLRSGNAVNRALSCELLGAMASDEAAAAIGALLSDGDEDVRDAAARALGQIADPHSIPVLLRSLGQQPGTSLVAVGTALLAIGPDGADELCRGLAAEEPEVRLVCARALGQLEVSPARDQLIELAVAETDPAVRLEVVRALGRLADPAVLEPLRVVLLTATNQTGVRVAAAAALPRVANDRVANEEALSLALGLLFDPRPEVCRAAAQALAAAGTAGLTALRELPETSSAAAYVREALAVADLRRLAGESIPEPPIGESLAGQPTPEPPSEEPAAGGGEPT